MLKSSSSVFTGVVVFLFLTFICQVSAQVGNRAPAPGPASRKYALSNRCTSADREAINRCEDESRRDWDVRDTDYVCILIF